MADVDLCDFLPPLASSNRLNKTELEPYIYNSDNLAYRPKRSKRKNNNFENWLEVWAYYENMFCKICGYQVS